MNIINPNLDLTIERFAEIKTCAERLLHNLRTSPPSAWNFRRDETMESLTALCLAVGPDPLQPGRFVVQPTHSDDPQHQIKAIRDVCMTLIKLWWDGDKPRDVFAQPSDVLRERLRTAVMMMGEIQAKIRAGFIKVQTKNVQPGRFTRLAAWFRKKVSLR